MIIKCQIDTDIVYVHDPVIRGTNWIIVGAGEDLWIEMSHQNGRDISAKVKKTLPLGIRKAIRVLRGERRLTWNEVYVTDGEVRLNPELGKVIRFWIVLEAVLPTTQIALADCHILTRLPEEYEIIYPDL